jgi:hypothetical protein
MNASNAKDYLPLVQALAEGKQIQIQKMDGSAWFNPDTEILFQLPANQYRIKPEPREFWIINYPDHPRVYLAPVNSSCGGLEVIHVREVL